ncbi:MAG: ABC transporter permease, partial [Planctomycetes bacterium]|nr:ABC transporter permease [Planctomycetota bacterium]
LSVAAVVPNQGLGRFSLSPTQQTSLCAFVDLATLQKMLDQPGKANAILVAGRFSVDSSPSTGWNAASKAGSKWLESHLRPQLEDLGLKLRRVVIGDAAKPVSDYFNLTSQRMLLPAEVERAAGVAWRDLTVQPVLTYLANDLEHEKKHVPYSTIAAVDSIQRLGPLLDTDGKPVRLADDEIVLIDWAANDLGAKPGDMIRVAYFDPETTHGEPREQTTQLRLKAIVPLAEADAPPLMTNDPELTPELKGVTDSKSIDKWLVPFKLTRAIRPRDDQYWTDHRTTPKAYVSLAQGRRLWGSRFGQTTSLRVAPADGISEQRLAERLVREIKPARLGLGLEFRPVKRDSLAAAVGTTPLDVLFLMFSAFLIAAVLMLLAVLFQLGIDQRAGEIGLLMAVGIPRRTITRLLTVEALLAGLLGALVGSVLGIGYAWLILAGLRSGWLSSVALPNLELYVTVRSMVAGATAGLLVAGVTIAFAVRRVGRVPVRRLLAGVALLGSRRSGAASNQRGMRRLSSNGMGIGALLLLAVILAFGSFATSTEFQAGLFFGSGALTLVAGLLAFRWLLQSRGAAASATRISLPWLAARNATLNPRRSVLCVGLMATVSFLIIATSAFRLEVSDAGSGGFNLLAESALPIFHNLSTPQGRTELGLSEADDALLSHCTFVPIRVHDGDDASCLNLFRPRQPRILGVPYDLAYHAKDKHSFQWGSTIEIVQQALPPPPPPLPPGPPDPYWHAIAVRRLPTTVPQPIPLILDENTARYSLGLLGIAGDTYPVFNSDGQKVTLEVIALLRNSIFQGDLLISEENLLKLFPDTRGYRYFLIRTPPGQEDAVTRVLEARLGDFGFDVTPSRIRLTELLAVQNTYLSTFQSLGALGLLLGTLGLAAVQLRSVLERRGELAILRAEGFGRRQLAKLVLYEIAALMLAGLGIGTAAALVAIWPHLWTGGAQFPWLMLCGTLLLVLVCGLSAGVAAVRAAVKMPLMAALRGE